MKNVKSYSYLSLRRRPAKTVLLGFLVFLLPFSFLQSAQLSLGMKEGMKVLDERLGADITVVPYLASTMSKVDDVTMQGHAGYFYMSRDHMDQISQISGVDKVSWQYYIARTTMKSTGKTADIFGIDPETDFTVRPWLNEIQATSASKNMSDRSLSSALPALADRQVWAGSGLGAKAGDDLGLFGVDCIVTGVLGETGTDMDNSLYVSETTTDLIIESLMKAGTNPVNYQTPAREISSVLIKVSDPDNTDGILGHINLYIDDIKAYRVRSATSGTADGILSSARLIGNLSILVFFLSLIMLSLIFRMLSKERGREFAILRVLGASRRMLSGIIFREGLMFGAFFGTIGTLAGILPGKYLTAALYRRLGLSEASIKISGSSALPGYSFRLSVILAAAAYLMTLAGCAAASAHTAYKVSRTDPGTTLHGLPSARL